MGEYYRYRRVCRLRGWTKWLPFLLLPFSALFSEVWLHTQVRERDYTLSKLNTELRELQTALDELKAQEAELQAMHTIEAHAPNLGLIKPAPSQIKIVYASGDSEVPLHDALFDLASLDAEDALHPHALGGAGTGLQLE